MPATFHAAKAEQLTHTVKALHGSASFRNILREAARVGIVRDHKTLRRYLDLLVGGGVLRMRTRDVGSVNLQQLYTVNSRKPEIQIGLAVLRRYGLNWEIPDSEIHRVPTDFEGLARSNAINATRMASLEDCLVHELREDVRGKTGAISFIVAMISTRTLDLPYLLRRADEMHVGKAARLLFSRVLEIVSSSETSLPASVFMAVRSHILKITRQYARAGFWKLVEESGVGNLGVDVVGSLTEYDVVMAAGKQLGVTG